MILEATLMGGFSLYFEIDYNLIAIFAFVV